MTHEDAGHYGAKHPEGTTYDPGLAAALAERVRDGRITCGAAFEVAESLGFPPREVGTTADLLEYRIVRCQLGLFGYSPDKRIVKPAQSVSDGLRESLEKASAAGRLSCATSWNIAQALGIEKMAVAEACELMGIKITHCQLGAF